MVAVELHKYLFIFPSKTKKSNRKNMYAKATYRRIIVGTEGKRQSLSVQPNMGLWDEAEGPWVFEIVERALKEFEKRN